MEPFFEAALDRLMELHREMEKCLMELPHEALNWVPGEGINSLAVLASHTAGAERYWIGDMLAGDSSNRVRAVEFEVTNASAPDLIERLRAALVHSEMTLSDLKVADLAENRLSPTHNRSFSVGWCILHTLDHTALHLGHMQITRQLWDQRPEGAGQTN